MQKRVAAVFFVLEEVQQRGCFPFISASRVFDSCLHQLLAYTSQTSSGKIGAKDSAYHPCILGNDLWFAIRTTPIAKRSIVLKRHLAIAEGFTLAPRDIAAHGFAFGLGEGAAKCQDGFIRVFKGVYVFLLKQYTYPQFLEHTHISQAVQRVAGKT